MSEYFVTSEKLAHLKQHFSRHQKANTHCILTSASQFVLNKKNPAMWSDGKTTPV